MFSTSLGKGTNVLQSGHDKRKSDCLRLEETRQSIGSVKVLCVGNSHSIDGPTFLDIALTKLPSGDVIKPMNIMLEPPRTRYKHRHTNFEICEDGKLMQNCITAIKRTDTDVNSSQMRAFHSEGESGLLATIPSQTNPNEVHPVMMLVGVYTMKPEASEEVKMSIGVPMNAILNYLSTHCRAQVEII